MTEPTEATLEAPTIVEPSPVSTPADAPVPAPAPAKKKSKVNNPYIWGLGRRKRAVARVRIRPGEGGFTINKRDIQKYFLLDKDRQSACKPMTVTDTRKDFDVFVNVRGGGITGQAEAVLLGLARALSKVDPGHELKLREQDLLRRDPRKVERKKPGQPGARKKFQFSKR